MTATQLADFRQRLAVWFERNAEKASPLDMKRALSMDWWLAEFLAVYKNDVDVAFPCFCETLKWRHDFGVNSDCPFYNLS